MTVIKMIFLEQQLTFLILLISSFSINAQKFHYTHQNKSLERIQENSIDWISYTAPIYNGLDNGVYWFKIENTKYRIKKVKLQ